MDDEARRGMGKAKRLAMRRRDGEQLEEHRVRSAETSGGRSSEPVHAAVLREVAGHAGGVVLDFGAGVGDLTRRLLQMGRFQVTGADIMARPPGLPESARWVRQDLNEALALQDGSFNLVIAVEVIEHLENPRAVAREWFRVLRPGGTLIVSTPNNESWRALLALLFRGHFVAFLDSCYPAHITALVRKDLQRILVEAGFADITFRFTDSGGIPKLPHLMWQEIGGRLFRGLRYSDNMIAIADKSAYRTPATLTGHGDPDSSHS